MNKVKVIGEGDISLRPTAALLLYQSHYNQVYATAHAIEPDPKHSGRRILGPGAPATKAALADFAKAVSEATAYCGFVPENLLYTSPNLLAWWTPAAVRQTWFRSNIEEIGERSGKAAHPALVFVVIPDSWFVFALKHSARPTPADVLCHAPHFNVYDSGRICTGNVSLPGAVTAESILAYEDAFFRSNFTHPNRKKAVNYQGGMTALWRDQLANPDPDSMTHALMRSKETLQAAIERIAKSSTR